MPAASKISLDEEEAAETGDRNSKFYIITRISFKSASRLFQNLKYSAAAILFLLR
jgi:hypothetical protein